MLSTVVPIISIRRATAFGTMLSVRERGKEAQSLRVVSSGEGWAGNLGGKSPRHRPPRKRPMTPERNSRRVLLAASASEAPSLRALFTHPDLRRWQLLESDTLERT